MQQTLFPFNTTEVRPIYLKMDHIMRKPVLLYVNNKGTHQPAHPRSLISAFVIRCLDSNEPAHSYIARVGLTLYLQPVSLRKVSYRYMCTGLSFTLQERCYTDFVSLCRCFCDKSF